MRGLARLSCSSGSWRRGSGQDDRRRAVCENSRCGRDAGKIGDRSTVVEGDEKMRGEDARRVVNERTPARAGGTRRRAGIVVELRAELGSRTGGTGNRVEERDEQRVE